MLPFFFLTIFAIPNPLCWGFLLVWSFFRDNRSLLNPIVMMIFLIFGYLYLAQLSYQLGLELLNNIFSGILLLVLPLLVLIGGFFLIYNGFILLRKEGRSKANYFSLFLGVAIVLFYALLLVRLTYYEFFLQYRLLDIPYYIAIYTYVLFGITFTGFLIYSWLYLHLPKKKNYDFIIIHGAGLLGGEKVTPLLRKRVDKAIEAFRKSTNPAIQLIASGGQGPDEKISEAQAIQNYILETTDIPETAVLLEDHSVNTYQNLLYSKQLGESLVTDPRFLFVTNDYHVFRTSIYAQQIGMKGDGLGCNTASYYIPSAFLRELVAIIVRLKWLYFVFYALFFLLIWASFH
ncbi:YdcF family protein [Streptococcus danieliae]|uniref:YdcF family protein n=2 Tax=Streptococcus danieliae TaxID=747656 RepID=A0A7Z0RQS3_9STRE|nr:YdcF family protein [Streptococcus danieliae]NYS49311.1 YdcF family protein [Streptococcus danieliae]